MSFARQCFWVVLLGLSVVAGACGGKGQRRPAPPVAFTPPTPYLQEIAAGSPLAHWRLDGLVEGALLCEPNGAERFMGQDHEPLQIEDFGGREATIELWARGVSKGALFSYATESHHDAMALACEGDALSLWVLDQRMETGHPCPDESWQHMAVTWRSQNGRAALLVEGREVWHQTVATGEAISTGGALVLGQRQDCVGGCWQEGLVGALDEVVVYDRALTPSHLLGHVLVARNHRDPQPMQSTIQPRMVPQFGHSGHVKLVRFSPDGRLLATGGDDASVKVWDMASGRIIHSLPVDDKGIVALDFSPDGTRLMTAGKADRLIVVWDISKGASVLTIGPCASLLTGAVFDFEGQRIVASMAEGQLNGWHARTGAPLFSHTKHKYPITFMGLQPDGERLVTADVESVKVWDGTTGELLGELEGAEQDYDGAVFSPVESLLAIYDSKDISLWATDRDEPRVASTIRPKGLESGVVVFSPDGRTLAVTAEDGIHFYDADTLESRHKLDVPGDEMAGLFISPDNSRLITVDKAHRLTVWNIATGERVASEQFTFKTFEPKHEGARELDGDMLPERVIDVVFIPGRQQFFAVGPEGLLEIWDAASGARLQSFFKSQIVTHALTFSPNGHWLTTANRDNTIRVWDARSPRLVHTLQTNTRHEVAPVYSPDGKLLVAAMADDSLTVLETATMTPRFEISVFRGESLIDPFFDAEGEQLIVKKNSKTLAVLDPKSGKILHTFIHGSDVLSANVSDEGRWLVVGLYDRLAVLWDLHTGERAATFEGHAVPVVHVAIVGYDPNVMTGDNQGTIRFWEMDGGEPIITMKSHTGPLSGFASKEFPISMGSDNRIVIYDDEPDFEVIVNWSVTPLPAKEVIFAPDGMLIAVRGMHIYLWDSASLESNTNLVLDMHGDIVTDMDFSPDGMTLASSGEDGTVRLWNRSTGQDVALIARGNDWISATPEGYFDASPGGASLLTMTHGTRSFGIEQMALTHNRPDILIDRIGAADRALEDLGEELIDEYEEKMASLGFDNAGLEADKALLRRKREHFRARYLRRLAKVDLEEKHIAHLQTELPTARILHVEAPDDEGNAGLDLLFQDRRQLKSYQIYVNNVPVYPKEQTFDAQAQKAFDGRRVRLQETIALSAGTNKIEIAARNARGQESRRDLALAEWQGEPERKLFFIGFGVSEYLDPEITDLSFAHQDVRDLAEYFDGTTGSYDSVQILALTDGDVTREAIEGTRDLLSEATVHDTVVLFVAGHGVRDSDEDRTYYYLTHDTKLDALAQTAMPFADIEDLLYNARPRNKLFLMDTCQSGEIEDDAVLGGLGQSGPDDGFRARAIPSKTRTAVFGAPESAVRAAPLPVDRERFIYRDLTRRSGAIVLSSSRGEEYSLESPEYQNGAFTEEILRALSSSEVDTNGDGMVSTDELRAHVISAVPELTGGRQHPTVDRDNLFVKFGLPLVGLP